MQTHGTTTFPLLQTVFLADSTGIVGATQVQSTGSTLKFANNGTAYADSLLSVPGIGFVDVGLVGGFYCYTPTCGSANGFEVSLSSANALTSGLNWTTYGGWNAAKSGQTRDGMYVTGFRTPDAAVPTTGTATYSGSVYGTIVYPQAGYQNGVAFVELSGSAAMEANFGSGNITGSLTNMTARGEPWNSVSLSGSISGGTNAFSGTAATTSSPGGFFSLGGSATGTFAGLFFGPNAQELGAVWTLYDGTRTAIGTIGAKRP